MLPLPHGTAKQIECGASPPPLRRLSFASSMDDQIQKFAQRGAASIYRIRNSIADISPAPSPDTSSPIMFTVSQQLRTLSNTARVDADKGMNTPPPPCEIVSDAFVRKSKRSADNSESGIENDAKTAQNVSYSTENALCAAVASAAGVKLTTHNASLPGAVQHTKSTAIAHAGCSPMQPDFPCETDLSAPSSSRSSPAASSPVTAARPPPASFACADLDSLTDEQEQLFQEAVLYLQLTVQALSFSIGSHSRYCKPALRILMSFAYICLLAVIISVYAGLPWLELYSDELGKALHPWWAVYMDSSPIAAVEAACVAFLLFDLVMNMFAQGLRTFYRENPLLNVSYTLVLCWFLWDLMSRIYDPGWRIWSKGFRPVALVRSVPKLEQVVGVFASTLLRSLKLTFFAAVFLLITGCLSVVVTRYACDKTSTAELCSNIRANWGSIDVSMLSSFVIITSSGYARLFEDFLSILFSTSKGDKTGALNFSMLMLMCLIVFGGALGLTALYTASVFDSFKKARSRQYLKQLGLEHRYLISSYIAACRAFDANDVDGLSESQVGAIIAAVMPRFRGHSNMLSLLFRLIDVDGGGTVNVIEYCRLCGVIMLDFQIIHEGVAEHTVAPDVVDEKSSYKRRMAASGAAVLGLLQHVRNPRFAMRTLRHRVRAFWVAMQRSYQPLHHAVLFSRRFCASKFARLSVVVLLWSHLVLTVVNAQVPPFKQDIDMEMQNSNNNTVSYLYRQNLNDSFDVFVWTTSVYLVLLLWLQYAFGVAKLNTAMMIMPVELLFIFLDLLNPVTGGMCMDCIWYARIMRSVRAPIIALSLQPFVTLTSAISQLLSTLAVYIAFFYIVLNLFTNLGHVTFRDLGFTHKGVPGLSFSTLQQTLAIAIELSTADDWDEIRFDLYTMTKNRVYDVFFVFYYIVFNLCTTNVVTSLAIECFEYLHEKEAINDDQNAESLQQQEFDMAKHMQDDDSYEIMPAPDGIQEIWTGRNEKHSFAEKDWKNSIFSRENSCCICSKRIVGTAIQCSLCHVNLHFECWQKTETAASSLSNSKGMQRFGTSFLRSPTLPACVSKLQSDALQLHFSVHVRKIVNLLDVLILGPKLQVQAPDYESLLDILDAAGQDERLVLFIEGLMLRQSAMDDNTDASANALKQSSQLWQSLYVSLQSGVVFVKRRPSAPSFKLLHTRKPDSNSPYSSRKNSVTQLLRGGRRISAHKLSRPSVPSLGSDLEVFSSSSRRSSIQQIVGSAQATAAASPRRANAAAADDAALHNTTEATAYSASSKLQRRRSFVELS